MDRLEAPPNSNSREFTDGLQSVICRRWLQLGVRARSGRWCKPDSLTIVCLAGAIVAWVCTSAQAFAQRLDAFGPSAIVSDHGKVSEVAYDTGLVDLPGGFLAHSPAGSERRFSFSESVWILSYRTSIYDASGSEPDQNYLCHTFLGDRPFTQQHDPKMTAIYSDSFTRQVRLPDGFGLFVEAGQELHWLPLFNNRSSEGARVGMRLEVAVIREPDLARPLRHLYSTLHSTHMPHLFFVPPERHEQETVVSLGFDGRIHFMGTHVHPFAESLELHNLTSGERVWKGSSVSGDTEKMTGFEVYSSADGYPVRSADVFRLTSVYNNSTESPIDAMAGLFILYSLDSE